MDSWGPGGLVACGLAAPGPQHASLNGGPDLFGGVRRWKALSLWQPWAALVARGVKIDETRHWSTGYRGPLAIHASKRLDVAGAPDELCAAALGPDWRDTVELGAVVAVAWLADVVPAASLAASLTRANRAAGNFAPGRFAWRLVDIRPLRRPAAAVGRQGLFNWDPPEDLEARLGPTLNHMAIAQHIGWGLAA